MSAMITSRLAYCRVNCKLPNCLSVEAGCLDDLPAIPHQIAVIIIQFSVVELRLHSGPGDENIADNDQRQRRHALVLLKVMLRVKASMK